MPSWLKGEISREVAEAAVDRSQEGSFCVRARGGVPDEYVLCVVYKGNATHHLIKKADDGNLSVNKKQYGQHTTIEQLIGKLGKLGVPGWPVRLIGLEPPVWLHGAISKAKSEELLMADGKTTNGRFLIRKHGDTANMVLSLVFRNKPTQHLIATDADGYLTVNKKRYGEHTEIESLVAAISSDPVPQNWPVRLCEYVSTDGEVASIQGGATSAAKASPKKAAKASSAGSAKKASSAGSAKKAPWLFEKMSNPEADDKLKGKLEEDGSFIVRVHNAALSQYVISVIYKGKPTHHLCVASDDKVSTINKKPTGTTGLKETIALIKKKQPFWPVPLKSYVASNSSGGGASSDSEEDMDPEKGDSDAAAAAEMAAAAEAAAAKKAAAEAKEAAEAAEEAAAEEAAKAEDKKAEGFKSLPNPFPEGPKEDAGAENESGYMTVGPTANELLSQARMIAIAASSGLDPEMKAKYGVGKILNQQLMGASSTDDWQAGGEYDLGGGGGGNPYMGNPGIAGTSAGVQKMASLESAVLEVDHRVNANRARIEGIEELMDALAEGLTLKQEVTELRAKNVTLEKKLLMLEQFLMKGAADDSEGDGAMTMTEVRLVHIGGGAAAAAIGKVSARGRGGASDKKLPVKADLANTTLVGKIGVMKGTSYGEMRDMISDQFDDSTLPTSYKFFSVESDSDELLMIHEKQEFKVTLDAYVVYVAVHGATARGGRF